MLNHRKLFISLKSFVDNNNFLRIYFYFFSQVMITPFISHLCIFAKNLNKGCVDFISCLGTSIFIVKIRVFIGFFQITF